MRLRTWAVHKGIYTYSSLFHKSLAVYILYEGQQLLAECLEKCKYLHREVLTVRGSNVRAGSTQGQAIAVGLPGGRQEQAPDQDLGNSTTVDFKVMLRKGAKSRSVQVHKASLTDCPMTTA